MTKQKVFNRWSGVLIGEFEIGPKSDLSGAHLYGANLYGANLSGANLDGANLYGANLKDAVLPKFQLPQNKTLYVWKKIKTEDGSHLICKLRIPRTSRRTAALVGNKCRAERAVVLEIKTMNGLAVSSGVSMHDPGFRYEVGKEVSVDNFNDDIRVECTSGIHFFKTEEEARSYVY